MYVIYCIYVTRIPPTCANLHENVNAHCIYNGLVNGAGYTYMHDFSDLFMDIQLMS